MRGWTWTNDNNKHEYKNSDSGNFSMMIKLKECMDVSFMLSHTVYFKGMMFFALTSQMYHRISVLVPVIVRVPEYLSTSTSTSTSTMTLELTSTSTLRVQEMQYSSNASTSIEYEYPSPGEHIPIH